MRRAEPGRLCRWLYHPSQQLYANLNPQLHPFKSNTVKNSGCSCSKGLHVSLSSTCSSPRAYEHRGALLAQTPSNTKAYACGGCCDDRHLGWVRCEGACRCTRASSSNTRWCHEPIAHLALQPLAMRVHNGMCAR